MRSACSIYAVGSGAWPVVLPVALWLGLTLIVSGCSATSRPTQPAELGSPVSLETLEAAASAAGPIGFEVVSAADWQVPRSGLIRLDHPRAVAVGLKDGPEPIEIFFYALTHPRFGLILVDSGVESGFARPGRNPRVGRIVEAAMDTESLAIHTTTADWIAARGETPAGVFLTHIHLDHVMGLPDVPPGVPVYVGPGESDARAFLNFFTRSTLDRMLEAAGTLEVWPFTQPADFEAPAILDVFGDGTIFALHVPGHTPGSVAFLVRAIDGPKLLVGDTCHTRWGWDNEVEPGTYTSDHRSNARALRWLRAFAARHPELAVHLGHQR